MSRLARRKITVPAGISVTSESSKIHIKKGATSLTIPSFENIILHQEGQHLTISKTSGNEPNQSLSIRTSKSILGTIFSSIKSSIQHISDNYINILNLVGVGYKARVDGKYLILNLGYSHAFAFEIEDGVEISVDKNTKITIKSIFHSKVSELSYKIRSLRMPEPYKGKGIFFEGETITPKDGKKAKK